MAQAQPEEKIEEEKTYVEKEMIMKETSSKPSNSSPIITSSSSSNNGVPFKFNVKAPEFVPRSHANTTNANAMNTHQMPISGFFCPWFQYLGAAGGSDWFFLGEQDPSSSAAAFLISNSNTAPNLSLMPSSSNKTSAVAVLTEDLRHKVIKQVEYQFSDMSLLANESMSRHISKDPEGYVPISVIASTKKMKSLISNNNHLLAQALRSSSKLVVNEDGKKVKRKIPFTDKDKEELQSRIVVVENLPDDHSHHNVEKIFSVVGSVKTIRICQPTDSNTSRSKSDFFMSNKLHALVEFANLETAEKAVGKLNDERNWRKGLRVRSLLRCSPKSVLKTRKSDFNNLLEDEDAIVPESAEGSTQPNNAESVTESNAEENSGASKKGWARVRGKGRGRGQNPGGRGLLAACPQSANSPHCGASAKPITSKGPRMPDGTKGFTVGRGKPLVAPPLVSPQLVE